MAKILGGVEKINISNNISFHWHDIIESYVW